MIPKEDRISPVINIVGLGVSSSGHSYAEAIADYMFKDGLTLQQFAEKVGFEGDLGGAVDISGLVSYLESDPRFEISVG